MGVVISGWCVVVGGCVGGGALHNVCCIIWKQWMVKS